MYWILGLLTVVGMVIGILAMVRNHIVTGGVQLVLTYATPLLTYLFCLKKQSFVFGGSDFAFLIQTATVEHLAEPWLLLILLVALVAMMLLNVRKLLKKDR